MKKKDDSVADLDENDSTDKSGPASADPPSAGAAQPNGRAGGSHALGAEPAAGMEPDGLAADGDFSDETSQELVLDDGDKELVAVGASSDNKVERADAVRDAGAVAPHRQKKVKATPRQNQVAEKERRTGPVTFLRESVGELQKVVYPTGQQLLNYFVVVLIFVLFIIAIVSLLDLAFGKAILAVFS